MAGLTDAVGNSNQSSLFTSRGRNKCCLPTELKIKTRVCAADEQDKTDIASSDIESALISQTGSTFRCGNVSIECERKHGISERETYFQSAI